MSLGIAAATLGAGGLGALGNLGGAYLQGQFNADQAKENREFQAYMSSTAYQRAANDLEKAGLNRILALGNPASTPGGAVGMMGNPNIGGGFAAGASAGTAAASAKQNIAESQQRSLKMAHEMSLIQQQIRTAKTEADMNEVKRGFYDKFGPMIQEAMSQAAAWLQTIGKEVNTQTLAEVVKDDWERSYTKAGLDAVGEAYDKINQWIDDLIFGRYDQLKPKDRPYRRRVDNR